MKTDPDSLCIDDLTEEDLSRISWSGSETHIKSVAEKLKLVDKGDAEYLALRRAGGNPVAKGLIDHMYGENSSEIGQLAVHPDLQGKGLGTKLIGAAEKRIADRGRKWAVMGVETENVRARKLYERLGYEEFGRDTDSWTAMDKSGREFTHYAELILMRKDVRA